MIKFVLLFLLLHNKSTNSIKLNIPKYNRRHIISSIVITQPILPSIASLGQPVDNIFIDNKKSSDQYSRWSFFNLVPPPIVSTINTTQLYNMINNSQISSLQIATQHDTLIITDKINHRYSLTIKDKTINQLFIDLKHNNSSINILPIDIHRQQVHNIFKVIVLNLFLYLLANSNNLLPEYLQFKTFNSLKERDEYYNNNTKSTK